MIRSFLVPCFILLLLSHPCLSEEQKEKKILFYRDPMGRNITSPVPAKDEMGMDFIPVYEEDAAQKAEPSTMQRSPVTIPQAIQQQLGITVTTVTHEALQDMLQVSGRVAFDPALFEAIENYKTALTMHHQSLINASTTRLKILGLTDPEIATLGSTDSKQFLLPKNKVWIYADIYEYELSKVAIGQHLMASTSALPGKMFMGSIASINPTLNAATRTIQVKAEVKDPEGLLKPDMFMNVEIHINLGHVLTVPESAVIQTGTDALVYVVGDDGRYYPRHIEIGNHSKGKCVVLEGLSHGESVVASANFLIDSESRIQAIIQKAQQK